MPAQSGRSSLVGKIGDRGRRALEGHKTAEPELDSFSELPAGIDGGIARLVECKFGEYKTGDMVGKPFFLAAGVVVSPESHEGQVVKGLRTSIGPEPICDTPNRSRKTLEAHLEWVQDQMKMLLGTGHDPDSLTIENIEATAQALKEAGVYFKFRTWKGKPQTEGPYAGQEPRTQHTWGGMIEYDGNGGSGGEGVQDDTGDETPPKPAPRQAAAPARPAAPAPAPRTPTAVAPRTATAVAPRTAQGRPAPAQPAARSPVSSPPPKPRQPAPPPAEEEFDETNDLTGLAKKAAKDPKAREELKDKAMAAGYSEDEVENADSWEAVVQLILSPREADEEPAADDEPVDEGDGDDVSDEAEAEETPEEVAPVKGDVILYQPAGAKKPVECEVTSVNEAKRTVVLKSLDTGKVLIDAAKRPLQVSWDDLPPAE